MPLAGAGVDRPPTWLSTATIVYLALPLAIFVLTWLRASVALIAGAAVVYVAGAWIRSELGAAREQRRDRRHVVGWPIWAWALVVGVLSGAGGYVSQTSDWLKPQKSVMRAAAPAGSSSIHQCPLPSIGATRAPVLSARRAILAGLP